MNWVFFLLIAGAVAKAAWSQWHGQDGAMAALSDAALRAAEAAIPLAFGLIGVMGLFLGLMKVAESVGLVRGIARLLTPVMTRLFPDVPAGHPAMGAMVMNVAANLLGLGNAATPFGIRAMEYLDRLNPAKGRATNAQVLFLVINTASVTVLPTSVLALRAAVGAADPAAVIAPTLIATLFSTLVAIVAAKALQRCSPALPPLADELTNGDTSPPLHPVWGWLAVAVLVAIIPLMALWGQAVGGWIVPLMLVTILGVGLMRGVPVYTEFVEGAKQGFSIATGIIPYLVAMLVAVGMFQQSGAMQMILAPVAHLTAPLGAPAEALALAGMRTLSGSGSFGLLATFMKSPDIGPDGFLGVLLGTIYGSSETTFYVIAVYFGAVGIRRIRHALAAGLIADLAGLVGAVAACRWLYG